MPDKIDRAAIERQKKRYAIFLSIVNKIWKLEKERLPLRESLNDTNEKLRIALGANGIGDAYNGPVAAGIGVLQKRKKKLEEDVEDIREKQREQIKEIEKFIIL